MLPFSFFVTFSVISLKVFLTTFRAFWKAWGTGGCFQEIMSFFSEGVPFSRISDNFFLPTHILPQTWRSFEKWEYCTWGRDNNLSCVVLWMCALLPLPARTSSATQLPLILTARSGTWVPSLGNSERGKRGNYSFITKFLRQMLIFCLKHIT